MSGYPIEGLKGASPADLDWLTGNWQGKIGQDPVEEHWSPLRANTLMGMFRWVTDGKVRFYELEAIEQEDELVFLRVKHFDPKLIGWEEKDSSLSFVLVELNDHGAVFRELAETDARWVVYRREGPDRLVTYFTRGSEPDPDPGVFDLVRH